MPLPSISVTTTSSNSSSLTATNVISAFTLNFLEWIIETLILSFRGRGKIWLRTYHSPLSMRILQPRQTRTAKRGFLRHIIPSTSRASSFGVMLSVCTDALPWQIESGIAPASVHTESITPKEDALLVEGIIELNLLLITGSDEKPFAGVKTYAPFSHQLEVKDLHESCTYEVVPSFSSYNFISSSITASASRILSSPSSSALAAIFSWITENDIFPEKLILRKQEQCRFLSVMEVHLCIRKALRRNHIFGIIAKYDRGKIHFGTPFCFFTAEHLEGNGLHRWHYFVGTWGSITEEN